MKVKQNRKLTGRVVEYEYDTKQITVYSKTKENLRQRCQQEGLTYTQLIEKLLNQKVCQCPNG